VDLWSCGMARVDPHNAAERVIAACYHGSRQWGRRRFMVAGASRDIGLAIAEALSADGHDVVGLARYPDSAFSG